MVLILLLTEDLFWANLIQSSNQITDSDGYYTTPWCVLGDFNVPLSPAEPSVNFNAWTSGIIEFKDCVFSLGITNLRYTRNSFTWRYSNINSPLFHKLDRVIVNETWLSMLTMSLADFPARDSLIIALQLLAWEFLMKR